MIAVEIIVSPIISTKIGSRSIVSWLDFRMAQDFPRFRVKDGICEGVANVLVESNKVSKAF